MNLHHHRRLLLAKSNGMHLCPTTGETEPFLAVVVVAVDGLDMSRSPCIFFKSVSMGNGAGLKHF